MGLKINMGLVAWDVEFSPANASYRFTLKPEYQRKEDAHFFIVYRFEGSEPLIVINQTDGPSNPVIRGQAFTEFLSFNDVIQKHRAELDEIPF